MRKSTEIPKVQAGKKGKHPIGVSLFLGPAHSYRPIPGTLKEPNMTDPAKQSSPLQIFGRADLDRAINYKVGLIGTNWVAELNADQAATAITAHSLHQVIAGRHLGKPITFAAAYELVYGERLGLKR